MRGVLFDDHEVVLHRDTARYGGSFQGTDGRGRLHAWDQNAIRFWASRCAAYDHPVMFDVGANTGSFALLTTLFNTMRVIAFEPQSEVRRVLQENVRANKLSRRVLVQPYALSDKNGTAELCIPENNGQSGLACMGTPLRFNAHWRAPVPTMRLDDWASALSRVDLVKIDTEGAELSILRGGEQFIRYNKPEMLIEYDARNTAQFGYEPNDIRDLLISWGAKVEPHGADLYAHWER